MIEIGPNLSKALEGLAFACVLMVLFRYVLGSRL